MGVIAPWYLKAPQFDLYALFHEARFPFGECSRRIGKTTTGLVYVLEKLRANKEWVWRWCEPWKYQAREVVMPEMDRLQATCPEEFKFKFYKTDSFYEGPNGSRLYLRGVNEDRGESARGSFSHGITCDEYGFWKDPDYIVNEVLMPQTLSTNGQIIKLSTPPRDLGHKYYEERERAAREKRFIQKIIWEFEGHLYTKEQIQDICEAVGGANSPAWRREFLCEPVSDPDALVIPEFTDDNIVEDDYPMPDFCDVYVGGDSGADDNTFILFAWYDFVKNEVVCDIELVTRGETTASIISKWKRTEKELWNLKQPVKRVYDANLQLIYDIIGDHGLSVSPPRKDQKLAAIHELRVEVQARRFKFKRRCANAIRQFKVGMWKDDRHLDFERSEGLGHLDGIDAAIYLNRAIDRSRNPVPRNFGFNLENSFIPHQAPEYSKNEESLRSVFRPKRGKR